MIKIDTTDKSLYNSITAEQYEEFEKCWFFYILKEFRYGQAFCEHFNIGNSTPLYFFKDNEISKRWISDNFLKHDTKTENK